MSGYARAMPVAWTYPPTPFGRSSRNSGSAYSLHTESGSITCPSESITSKRSCSAMVNLLFTRIDQLHRPQVGVGLPQPRAEDVDEEILGEHALRTVGRRQVELDGDGRRARVTHHEARAVGLDDGGELVERRLRSRAEERSAHAPTIRSWVGTARCGSSSHDCAIPGPPAATMRMFAGDASDRLRSKRPVASA